MNINISKSIQNITAEQIETALLARGIKVDNFKRFNVVRIIGDALDTAKGKGLHAAMFSTVGREVVINAYPVSGQPYITIRISI
jgi:hypothetical protein